MQSQSGSGSFRRSYRFEKVPKMNGETLSRSDIECLKRRIAHAKMAEVSTNDMNYYYEAFHEFDKDANGYVSASSLGDLMRSLGENPTGMELETLINEVDDDSSGHIEFPEFLVIMVRRALDQKGKEHLHWQETFRVFTTPNTLPGTHTKVGNNGTDNDADKEKKPAPTEIDAKGNEVTVIPRTYESSGLDREPKVVDRELPIDEFRFVMSSLNISGRRIVEMREVEEMIKAVDDGDGQLDYDEFIKLIQTNY